MGGTALKGNNTSKKTINVAGDIYIIPKELIKLHKYVFMTGEILSVNDIPFLFC